VTIENGHHQHQRQVSGHPPRAVTIDHRRQRNARQLRRGPVSPPALERVAPAGSTNLVPEFLQGVNLMSKSKIKRGASAAAAAAHINLSGVSFARLLNLGVIVRQAREVGYDLRVVRLARLNQLEALAAGRGGEDGGAALSVQRAKLAAAQASRAEFQNMQDQGQYVELSLMKRMLVSSFLVMREIALGTAGKISDSLQAFTPLDRAEIYKVIHGEIIVMLESLSDPNGLAAQAADKALMSKKAPR
jgi:phage terminase Nu1 subunit (DNA packaging protein)